MGSQHATLLWTNSVVSGPWTSLRVMEIRRMPRGGHIPGPSSLHLAGSNSSSEISLGVTSSGKPSLAPPLPSRHYRTHPGAQCILLLTPGYGYSLFCRFDFGDIAILYIIIKHI